MVVITFSNLEFARILVYYISIGLKGWEVCLLLLILNEG